jgi:hypothetical protein
MAARIAPRTNAVTMIRSTLMPISRAVSGSCAVACMARPVLLRFTNSTRPTMHTSATTMIEAFTSEMLVGPRSIGSPAISRGNACPLVAPSKMCGPPGIGRLVRTSSCRKIDNPIAVINGASRGACRSGR